MSTLPLSTNTYHIINVKSDYVADLNDEKDGTPLCAAPKADLVKFMWKVTKLPDGTYTIVNSLWKQGAFVRDGSTIVEGNSATPTQWIIAEHGPGQHTICTIDSSQYWTLEDNKEETPITLRNGPDDEGSVWVFECVV